MAPQLAMRKRKTIGDVATRAGVSKVTVSYVMTGQAKSARISQATVDKVIEAAKELDYRPNALARMLATKKADAIAVVFQYGDFFGANGSFVPEVMRSVCTACVHHGVDLMLHTKSTENPRDEAINLMDGRVDAVLLIRDMNDPTYEHLINEGFPTVQFFGRSDNPHANYVVCDNVEGGRLAAEHLLGLGHRRFAILRGAVGSSDSQDRIKGFTSALSAADIEVPGSSIVPLHDGEATSKEFDALFADPETRPTALFVWSDDDAIASALALRSRGLRVPQDVSVVGFDGTVTGQNFHPKLTTVRQPIELIARAAVDLAIRIAGDPGTPTTNIVLPPALVLGGTSAPPPTSRTNPST